jgi:hypothetical protein
VETYAILIQFAMLPAKQKFSSNPWCVTLYINIWDQSRPWEKCPVWFTIVVAMFLLPFPSPLISSAQQPQRKDEHSHRKLHKTIIATAASVVVVVVVVVERWWCRDPVRFACPGRHFYKACPECSSLIYLQNEPLFIHNKSWTVKSPLTWNVVYINSR